MAKIVVENHKFEYDMGCRMLKLKHDKCPFPELEDIWEHIIPLTFAEIAQLPNLEERRVGINSMGIDRLVKEINPVLVSKETIKKKTTWVDEAGNLVEHEFNDTYELFAVDGTVFSKGLQSWEKMRDAYYIRCKDTSTDREYLIWVNPRDVYDVNQVKQNWDYNINKVNAIDCISWTIQTNVKKGGIEKIIRQGDCILIKTLPNAEFGGVRHLTGEEYRTLLVAES